MNKILQKLFMSTILLSNCAFANETYFANLSAKRHSGYSFDPAKTVSKDQMLKMAQAASFAPSSYNEQPWRFIFCDKKETPKSYERALQSLVDPNKEWAQNAPLLIIVLTDTVSNYNSTLNRFAEYDAGAAAISLVYEATDLGLMAHQMGGYDVDKIKKDFSIPKNLTPMAVIAVGYEKENETITPKNRRPLGESFFIGELNKSIQE